MATISTFQSNVNILKLKFEINFGSVFENWTSKLQSFDFFQELSEKSYGICETTAYFELKIPNPSSNWLRQGLPVKMTISITDDNGASWFDYVVFEGKTSRKTTATNFNVKIQARDRLYELMAKNPPFRGQFGNWIETEINSLISNTWPGQAISFNDHYNYPIQYVQSDDNTLGEQVLEFAKVSACMVIFESNTIKFVSGEEIAIDNSYTLAGDIPLSRIGIGDYGQNYSLDKNEYFNVFKATGSQYIPSAHYFNKTYSGMEILPTQTLYLEIDLGSNIAITINSSYTIMYFRVADDDVSSYAPYQPISLSITANNKILFKIRNPNAYSIYLRSAWVNGLGLIKTATFTKTWENTSQITADGEKIVFEIESKVAQDEDNLDNLIDIQQAFTNEYFEFKSAWSPNFKVGKVVTARTPQNVQFTGIITKIEATVSMSDPRLVAKIRLRKFVP